MTEPLRSPVPGRRTRVVAARTWQPDSEISSAVAVPAPAAVADATMVRTPVPIAALRRAPGDPVIHRKWVQQTYQVSDTDRTLHVEQHPPVWGSPSRPGKTPGHPDRRRAVLFETMSTIDKAQPLVSRLKDVPPAARNDVALSVVVNGPWTTGADLQKRQKQLEVARAALVDGWKGPPLVVLTAAWERRKKVGTDEAETVQSSVPYTTFRALAASNPAALELDAHLSDTHDVVWHKMGDDDMPIFDPNPEATAVAPLETEPEETVTGLTLKSRKGRVTGAETKRGKTGRVETNKQKAVPVEPTKLLEPSETKKEKLDPDESGPEVEYNEFGQPPFPSELKALEYAEKDFRVAKSDTMLVTFGYDLTTGVLPGSDIAPPGAITSALQRLYRVEMQLRDQIHSLQAPIYPSEPTTFYRLASGGKADALWRNVAAQKTGGSGQQLEGAKLLLALEGGGKAKHDQPSTNDSKSTEPSKTSKAPSTTNNSPKAPDAKKNPTKFLTPTTNRSADKPSEAPRGAKQYAFHTVQVQTSAGGRNDALVRLLHGWLAEANVDKVDVDAVEAEINKLDQCALKAGEYLDKVFAKLPGPAEKTGVMAQLIDEAIKKQRTTAAVEICDEIVRAIKGGDRPEPLAVETKTEGKQPQKGKGKAPKWAGKPATKEKK